MEVVRLEADGPRPWLESLMFRDLVFALDWEDPRTQRRALQVGPGDRVLTITAAGCNALDLLLDDPAELSCVDGNDAQTRLLELKLAAIERLEHPEMLDLFAARAPHRARELYPRLRPALSPSGKRFWDHNIALVSGDLHRTGRIGLYLRLLRGLLRLFGLGPEALAPLCDAPDLETQRSIYRALIEPRLRGRIARAFAGSRALNALSGMHPEQLARIEREGGFASHILDRLERVLTEMPLRDNYFIAVAATGGFREVVPRYLRREHFDTLRERIDRVRLITAWVDPLLDTLEPESLDAIHLLDIFDWMTPGQVAACMARVARVARPGARLLYRAACVELDPPASVVDRFDWDRELSARLLAAERSIIHGSVYALRRR